MQSGRGVAGGPGGIGMSRMRLLAMVAGLGAVWGAGAPVHAAGAAPPPAGATDGHPSNWKTIEDYCVGCHNATDWAGKVAFDTMSADEMAEQLSIILPERRDYETVAGLVIDRMQHLPATGEKVDAFGWRFEVVDLDGRRIDKVLATRAPHDLDDSG